MRCGMVRVLGGLGSAEMEHVARHGLVWSIGGSQDDDDDGGIQAWSSFHRPPGNSCSDLICCRADV